jgi:hypothetical protein
LRQQHLTSETGHDFLINRDARGHVVVVESSTLHFLDHPQPLTTSTNGWKVNKVGESCKRPIRFLFLHLEPRSQNLESTSTSTLTTMASAVPEKDKSKVHKLSLKGSAKLVAEFVSATGNPTH